MVLLQKQHHAEPETLTGLKCSKLKDAQKNKFNLGSALSHLFAKDAHPPPTALTLLHLKRTEKLRILKREHVQRREALKT